MPLGALTTWGKKWLLCALHLAIIINTGNNQYFVTAWIELCLPFPTLQNKAFYYVAQYTAMSPKEDVGFHFWLNQCSTTYPLASTQEFRWI